MNIEREVRDLVARRDIMKAVQAYMRGQDRLDHALQLSAFHDDADVDCGLLRGGPSAYTDFAQGLLAGMKASQHLIGQVDLDVDIDAGTASGEVYYIAWHRVEKEDGDEDLLIAGRYVDDYAFRNDRWAIQRRRELVDWARQDGVSDNILHQQATIHLAGRKGKDFSETRDWSSGTSCRD